MKQMKRIAALLLLVAVAVGCAGCGKAGEKTLTAAEELGKEGAIRNTKNGGLIYLGMTREEVEKVTGPEVGNDGENHPTYKGGLSVYFSEAQEEARNIQVSEEKLTEGDTILYKSFSGIAIGDPKSAVREKYGNKTMEFFFGEEYGYWDYVGLALNDGKWEVQEPHERYDLNTYWPPDLSDTLQYAVIQFPSSEDTVKGMHILMLKPDEK